MLCSGGYSCWLKWDGGFCPNVGDGLWMEEGLVVGG